MKAEVEQTLKTDCLLISDGDGIVVDEGIKKVFVSNIEPSVHKSTMIEEINKGKRGSLF